MANIHKEINQLEHWLITLPNQGVPSGETTSVTSLHSLTAAIDRLSKQFDVQQHALNHIVDRLDILERDRDPADSQESAPNDYLDPWIDSSRTPLQNEIIDVLEPAYKVPDPVYTVHKTETLFEPPFVAPLKEETVSAIEALPVIQAVIAAVPEAAPIIASKATEPVPTPLPEAFQYLLMKRKRKRTKEWNWIPLNSMESPITEMMKDLSMELWKTNSHPTPPLDSGRRKQRRSNSIEPRRLRTLRIRT